MSKKDIKAKLTFEFDGKVICMWNLKFPKGEGKYTTFKLIEMGYYNGTLLQAIAREFDPQKF